MQKGGTGNRRKQCMMRYHSCHIYGIRKNRDVCWGERSFKSHLMEKAIFYGRVDPSRHHGVLLTTKSPGFLGTHLIDLKDLGGSQWFLTQDPSIQHPND